MSCWTLNQTCNRHSSSKWIPASLFLCQANDEENDRDPEWVVERNDKRLVWITLVFSWVLPLAFDSEIIINRCLYVSIFIGDSEFGLGFSLHYQALETCDRRLSKMFFIQVSLPLSLENPMIISKRKHEGKGWTNLCSSSSLMWISKEIWDIMLRLVANQEETRERWSNLLSAEQ